MKPRRLPTLVVLTLLATALARAEGLLMVDNPARLAARPALALSAAAFAGNDLVAIDRFEDRPWPTDYRSRPGENLALGMARLEVSGARGGWRVGYFQRQDWLLAANRDTVDAHALEMRNQLIGLNRTFALDYELRGIAADGLKLGHAWNRRLASGGSLALGMAATLLRGRDLRLETARGTLVSQIGSARLNGSRQQFHTDLKPVPLNQGNGFNDFTPAQALPVNAGWGFGLDLGATWQAAGGARVSLALNDLFGRIEWARVPVLRTEVNDASVSCDAAGCLPERLNTTWRSTYEPLTLKLKPRFMIEGEYPLGTASVAARLEGADGRWFPQVGLSQALGGGWRAGLDYETRFGAVGVSLRRPGVSLAISGQGARWRQARALGVSAAIEREF